MKTPDYLIKGDKVGIVASARKISKEEIEPAVSLLKKWGLEVVLGNNLFKSHNQFAGTDNERATDLQTMLDDESIKAIIIARGGYGTVRIIDGINFKNFIEKPKWVVGYSDVTVLHSHIHNLGIKTLHATMPINFFKNSEATESLRRALFAEELSYKTTPYSLNRCGKVEAQLIGGNLSLLYALMASPSEINTQDKILFIEDLDEYLYHVDRMIMNLKRAGKLSGLAGLIVGGMTDMKDNLIPFGKTAEEIIFDAVHEFNYPVCFNFPAGHVEKNMALIFGKKANLNVNTDSVSLVF